MNAQNKQQRYTHIMRDKNGNETQYSNRAPSLKEARRRITDQTGKTPVKSGRA